MDGNLGSITRVMTRSLGQDGVVVVEVVVSCNEYCMSGLLSRTSELILTCLMNVNMDMPLYIHGIFLEIFWILFGS